MDHSSQYEGNEQRLSAQKEKSLQQENEDENKIADKRDGEAEKTSESRNEVSMLYVRISPPYHFAFKVGFMALEICVENEFCI